MVVALSVTCLVLGASCACASAHVLSQAATLERCGGVLLVTGLALLGAELHPMPDGMDDFKNWRFHPHQTVELLPEGGALVRFRASGMLELAWHLFCWSNKIEIIAPVSLREQMATEFVGCLGPARGSAAPFADVPQPSAL